MLYWVGCSFFRFFYPIWYRIQVSGGDNLPPTGGVIVASNHVSYLDPPFVGAFLSRKVHFMAKKELFRFPPFGAILRAVGTFPVDREKADRQAIKTALSFLEKGEILGIFPEGRRTRTGELQEGALGMAFLAAKAQVPVLPAGIRVLAGSPKICTWIPRLRKMRLVFGQPIPPPPPRAGKEDLQAYTARVMEEIEKLMMGA
jgi:1-acyl-sn-glycerol-3-phosphate acyltransferase